MEFSDCRILVSLPCYGGQLYDSFQTSWTKILRWATDNKVHVSLQSICNESLLPRARNMGVMRLLDYKDFFTHILFVDADMGFNEYRLARLLAFDHEFAGCPGPTKYIHWENLPDAMLCGKNPEASTLRYALNFLGPGELKAVDGFAEVKDFGCCFCLVKTEAILKMTEAYPDLKCDHMAWINGKPSESTNNYAFFDTYVDHEGRYLECDHAFMARWRQCGGKVHADLTSDLSHTGTHRFQGDMGQRYFGRKHHSAGFTATHTSVGDKWDNESAATPKIPEMETVDLEKDKFHVTIIRPEGNRFPLCFLETAKLIQYSLQDLGYDCTRRENRIEEDRINIVFGWHLWEGDHPLQVLRNNRIILYQGEQLAPGGRPMPDWYFHSFGEALAVWDYSIENIQFLDLHDRTAQHVPPNWHPKSEVIEYSTTPKEYDVLFIGSLNLRREFMMKLIGSVTNSKALMDVWGPERDEIIAASKLVVNIHFYESETLELLRLSHLLASGVPVISEEADSNPYEDGIISVPYQSILAAVLDHLGDDKKREELGQRGKEKFMQTDMTETVKEVLSALTHKEVEKEVANAIG